MLVRGFIWFLPPLTTLKELLIDSILVSVIVSPILYFFAFRPLTIIIARLRHEEDKVSKSEEKFRKAFMTSPDAVNINRMSDGMYVSANEGFFKILGYTEEDVLGKTSLELNIWAHRKSVKNL